MNKLPKVKSYCEMCGKRNLLSLQVSLDPLCTPKTLCGECREGSMLLITDYVSLPDDLVTRIESHVDRGRGITLSRDETRVVAKIIRRGVAV